MWLTTILALKVYDGEVVDNNFMKFDIMFGAVWENIFAKMIVNFTEY